MSKPYKRESYLKKIRPFYDSDIIKVITGIRRCGKSCLLRLIIDELLERGINNKDIIDINLDKRGFKSIKTSEALERAIETQITDSDFKYLFIDEIQNVKGFEELINSYREDGGFSVFITGSNSYLLSGELITKLTGRFIEFEMYPLSFYEYVDMKAYLGKPQYELSKEFEDYLTYGGFPKALEYDDSEVKLAYVSSVVEQIIEKDVKGRQKIRNNDIFERVMTYVINNFGATTSISSITEYFNNTEHVALKRDTVKRYLQILENAKIISKCTRFDMKSKKSLGAEEKY
jgi:predicted AAA+ superfamily ATPase